MDLDSLTREQLEQRRNELHVQLAAVNDRLQAHVRARVGRLAADEETLDQLRRPDGVLVVPTQSGAATLDPSE